MRQTENVYVAHTQPLWPIRASSLWADSRESRANRLGPPSIGMPTGVAKFRPTFANFHYARVRTVCTVSQPPFGRDAPRNVHMCLCYHLYLYTYMYIVRTGSRPARHLYKSYVAQPWAGENHSDIVRVHISKIESRHFTIHFLFRSTKVMKNGRWIHLYTYVHYTSEHDTVERCVACKQFQKQSFNLESGIEEKENQKEREREREN